MPRRPTATPYRPMAPTAPRRRPRAANPSERARATVSAARLHPLTDRHANRTLQAYDQQVKGAFDRIVPLLKRLSALQHEANFIEQAQHLAIAELGFALPLPVLEKAWVSQLDIPATPFSIRTPSGASPAVFWLRRSMASCSPVASTSSTSRPVPMVGWPMPWPMP
jgi:hypothetical protein